MSKRKLLSGNYETPRPAEADTAEKKEKDFEREVLSKLGGSIAMVRTDKMVDRGEGQ